MFSHIIGQIDDDNNGISGIEKKFDYELREYRDYCAALIAHHETTNIEFKETFERCVHTGNRKIELKHSVLKTIVAFLNSKQGGILLVGVSDLGELNILLLIFSSIINPFFNTITLSDIALMTVISWLINI